MGFARFISHITSLQLLLQFLTCLVKDVPIQLVAIQHIIKVNLIDYASHGRYFLHSSLSATSPLVFYLFPFRPLPFCPPDHRLKSRGLNQLYMLFENLIERTLRGNHGLHTMNSRRCCSYNIFHIFELSSLRT